MPERVLRQGWRRVKFGDFADNVTDRVDDPRTAGVDRYVGLEHLDSGSLKIRRWGAPSDVEATKLRFRRGDIIFGRRRAYQRKVAVADFDGICSAHAMVLRARAGAVERTFLPFFLQSDLFMERAEAISVGSLSPTVNWRTLAAQEFELPSLKEQARLAALFESLEDCRTSYHDLHVQASNVSRVLIERFVEGDPTILPGYSHKTSRRQDWRQSTLGDICILGGGHGFRPLDWSDDGVPIIRIQNLNGSKAFNYYAGTVEPAWIVEPGELLFAWAGVPGVSFGPCLWPGPRGVLNQHIFRVTPKPGIEKLWLYEVLRYLTPRIERRAHGFKTSLLHIRRSEFTSQQILIPPGDIQKKAVEWMSTLRANEQMISTRIEALLNLRTAASARLGASE